MSCGQGVLVSNRRSFIDGIRRRFFVLVFVCLCMCSTLSTIITVRVGPSNQPKILVVSQIESRF